MTSAAFLLDTNICIYLLDGRSEVAASRVQSCSRAQVITSAIVYAEVMIGAERCGASEIARAFFRQVVPQPFDEAAGVAYSRLPFKRGSLDRLIAAHALALDLTLVTANEGDFPAIPDLRVENWTR